MVLRHTLSAFTLSWLIVCSVAGGACAAWQLEMVDGAAGSGGFCSLALDGAGQPSIAYADWTDQDRLVLAQQFGQWQSEEVEQAAQQAPTVPTAPTVLTAPTVPTALLRLWRLDYMSPLQAL